MSSFPSSLLNIGSSQLLALSFDSIKPFFTQRILQLEPFRLSLIPATHFLICCLKCDLPDIMISYMMIHLVSAMTRRICVGSQSGTTGTWVYLAPKIRAGPWLQCSSMLAASSGSEISHRLHSIYENYSCSGQGQHTDLPSGTGLELNHLSHRIKSCANLCPRYLATMSPRSVSPVIGETFRERSSPCQRLMFLWHGISFRSSP